MKVMAVRIVPVLVVLLVFAPIVYIPAARPSGCNYSCVSGGHESMLVSVTQTLFGFGVCVRGSNYLLC